MTDIFCNFINFIFSLLLSIKFINFDFTSIIDNINNFADVMSYFNYYIDTIYIIKLLAMYFTFNLFIFNFNLIKLIRFMLPFI